MHKSEISLGGRALTIETGKWAKQADGSVIVRMGDTMVLVTACHAGSPREGIDFLPLTVDYREYTYASGRIPGGFFKREGKATEKETLTSRLIDRPIRPLFPAGWAFETQVIAFVLSADTENDSDVLAMTGASAALALSEMPRREDRSPACASASSTAQYVVNPTFAERKLSRLDLIVAGSKDGIVMVEAGANEVSEEEVIQALEVGPRRDQGHLRGDRRHGQGGRAGTRCAKPESSPSTRASTRPSKPRRSPRSPRPCASRARSRTTPRSPGSRRKPSPRCPKNQADPQGRGQGHPARAAGEGPAHRDPRAQRPPRRPQVRRDPPDHHRDQGAAPRARLGRVHARRDPGPGHRHARHRRRPAEDRDGRRRDLEALHAALQLPALLGR